MYTFTFFGRVTKLTKAQFVLMFITAIVLGLLSFAGLLKASGWLVVAAILLTFEVKINGRTYALIHSDFWREAFTKIFLVAGLLLLVML